MRKISCLSASLQLLTLINNSSFFVIGISVKSITLITSTLRLSCLMICSLCQIVASQLNGHARHGRIFGFTYSQCIKIIILPAKRPEILANTPIWFLHTLKYSVFPYVIP